MNDDSYYRCLDVLDRINQEAIYKFNSGYGFSLALGRDKSFWNNHYGNVIFPRLPNILTYAKLIDVNVDYLLTGKNRKHFLPCVVCCDRIYQKYKSTKISVDNCHKYAPIMFKVKRGSQVNLGTLFELEGLLKTPAYELGFKEVI